MGVAKLPMGYPLGAASLTMKHPMEGPSSQWGAQWVVVGSHWAFQSAKMPPNGTRHGPNTVDHSPGHWHWHYGVQCPRLRLLIPCNHPQLSKTPSCSCSVYTQAEVHAVPPAAGPAPARRSTLGAKTDAATRATRTSECARLSSESWSPSLYRTAITEESACQLQVSGYTRVGHPILPHHSRTVYS